MSDIEHQLIADVAELNATVRRLAETARRALDALRDAQDARGTHEQWIDDASDEATRALTALPAAPS